MSQRRMFSPQIIDSDAFLDMSPSAQSLYFHLGMRADDDGFVGNPRKILRMVGGNEDDLKILLAKRFILTFQSGVIVIKHWRLNNLIRKDWYKETVYLEEKNSLIVKENGVYSELVNENATKPPRRLGKVSIGKVRLEDTATDVAGNKSIPLMIDKFKEVNPSYQRLFSNTTQRSAVERLLKQYGELDLGRLIDSLKEIVVLPFAPRITTPLELERDMGKLRIFLTNKPTNKYKSAII